MATKIKRNIAPLISDEELHRHRLGQLMHVFGQADTTLAGHRVTCKIAASGAMGDTPAASHNGIIEFNADSIRDVNTVEGLVKVNGLNYHELSHVLFTPQRGPLLEAVRQAGTFVAFNVLEDQRIETLLTMQYPSVVPYLTATVAEYFADTDPNQHRNSWPYLYGRKYLPGNMRTYFEGEAYNPTYNMTTTLRRCEQIIDAYCKLDPNDSRNAKTCEKLIHDFSNIIGTTQQFSPFGHQSATGPATGGSAGSGSGAPGGNSSQQSNTQQAQQAGQGQGKGAGLGTGGGTSTDPNAPALDKTNAKRNLKSLAQRQTIDANVQQDVRRQREAMKRGRRLESTTKRFNKQAAGLTSVDDSVRRLATAFGKQLKQLVVDSDPGWHTHQPSGRINVQRAMHGGEIDTVFDTWDGGKQDADSIEMVVNGDISGSMDTVINDVADVLWMLKYGTELVSNNAECTVMLFDQGTTTMYSAEDKASPHRRPVIHTGGSTNPAGCISETKRIMGLSKKAHKIALFVTDGSWSGCYGDTDPHADNIRLLNQHGVMTAVVFLAGAGYNEFMDPTSKRFQPDTWGDPQWRMDTYGHGAQMFVVAEGAQALGAFGRKLVKSVIRNG